MVHNTIVHSNPLSNCVTCYLASLHSVRISKETSQISIEKHASR